MASDVDICNLSLGHLGDTANVASINPPEASVQAQLCSRFYPMARDSLLEMHTWGFSTKRVQLAQVSFPWTEWRFAYACPQDALNLLAVLKPEARSDYENALTKKPEPQPFVNETDANGNSIILTNVPQAVLRYTGAVTDTTQFSPLFVVTLSWHLASFLAGPLLKGDVGADEAKRCAAMAEGFMSKATASDANQRKVKLEHVPEFVRARGIAAADWPGRDGFGR